MAPTPLAGRAAAASARRLGAGKSFAPLWRSYKAGVLNRAKSIRDKGLIGAIGDDQVAPIKQFANDPSVLGGVGAAVTLPTVGRSGMFARLMKAANEAQLVGPPKMHSELLQSLPALKAGAKGRPRESYRVDLPRMRGDRYPEELDRIVAVQDAGTGTTYFTTGGYHHAELEKELASRGIKGKWLQHDVFPANPELDVPARLNLRVYAPDRASGLTFPDAAADTPAATFARMRLLRNWRKQGINPAPPSRSLGRW